MANFATHTSLDSARLAWALRVMRIGGVIQACFATLWLVRGSLAVGGPVGMALAAVLLAVALAALLIVGAITAFIVVAVIGGPVTGIMYWLSAQRARPRSRTGS